MIYFITAREISRVKIGFSAEPRSRFVKMRTDSPVPLTLERICDGEAEDERALHARFAADRLRGEWFNLSQQIQDFMDALPPLAEISRPLSTNKLLVALGMSKGYASQLLSQPDSIPVPVSIAAYRAHGVRLGKLVDATPAEIDVLEKYCGCWSPRAVAA